ncbi:MAG: hypothetical protein NXI32_09770 [bacterium]|nr:hypothetical protein [bacterium]
MGRLGSRRAFLKSSTVGGVVVGADLGLFSGLPRVAAADAQLKQGVQFHEQVEPLVRLIEDTQRKDLLERIADRIRGGASYQQVLAALLLAGIRNVQPRPSVGFKFHCVLVVNSCHLASLAGPDEDRWLPIFWALDYFKSSQADESERSGWHMQAVNESQVPSATHCVQEFRDAMEGWDVEKADAATAGLVRALGAHQVFQEFARYAARDYRSIGHKAIYLANAWRTLQVIGWEHAEPVMRSLAFALLNHSGEPNPAESDLAADRPWRENQRLLARIPAEWLDGKQDPAVARQLFAAFRGGTPSDAAEVAAAALEGGVGPQTLWDGVFVGAGELLMRQPGIIGLHGLTTANAMHFLYQAASGNRLRQRILLQACSFNPMFRQDALDRGKLSDVLIDDIPGAEASAQGQQSIVEALADISGDRMRAAAKVQAYLNAGGSGTEFVDAARRVLFAKGRDAHDYKFASAVLEDYYHVSPAWRNQFLATSVFHLRGSGHPDSGLVERTRAAFS